MSRKIRVGIVNDDPLYALELELLLASLNYKVVVAESSEATEIVAFIVQESPDVVLSDIFFDERPAGLLLAREFMKRDIAYILFTSDDEPGIFETARRMEPYGYLVRPFDRNTIDRTIKLALIHHANSREAAQVSFPFSAKNRQGDLVKSDYNDIAVIESSGNRCWFYLSEEKLMTYTSFVKLSNLLPTDMFVRVHRRYMVATSMIKRINVANAEVYVGDIAYPIGSRYKKDLIEFMNR